MVTLTADEIKWLGENYPQLFYDAESGIIQGTISFRMHYQSKENISDSYFIKIDMSNMESRSDLPIVYNPDNRILKIAKRKKKFFGDLHLNSDNSLCLIFPPKVSQYYPNGFSISTFITHLCSHLYWVSYYERYNEEPWPGEKHGFDALLDYIIENPKLVKEDKNLLQIVRCVYKKKNSKGIALCKLRNKIDEENFLKELFEK